MTCSRSHSSQMSSLRREEYHR